jgi:hypothetical protein
MSRKTAMKVLTAFLALCLAAPLWYGGCSEEKAAYLTGGDRKVVVPIRKAPQGDAEFRSPRGDEGLQKTEEELGDELDSMEIREVKTKPSDSETGEKEAEIREEVTEYYIVRSGESLSEIAGRKEVYGDPLKWPILYFYNMDKIGELQLIEGFLDRDLPEGERLQIITPREAQENLQRRTEHSYVVNVISARTQKGLISSAIRLMREGYPVYITSATVKERQWMRLRVGFFKARLEASLEMRKINDLLRIHNSWVTQVGQGELEEFGGLIHFFREGE